MVLRMLQIEYIMVDWPSYLGVVQIELRQKVPALSRYKHGFSHTYKNG